MTPPASTEPMHYPDYPDICGSIRSMANAVSGLGVVTKPASQIRIEKRLWEIADALEKRYKEDRARGVAQQASAMAVGESRFACPFQTGCEDGEGFCEYPCEKWLDWHDAALIAQEREKWERERAGEHRTYESCHKHFACPDGEECWYSSADYYWDCGEGATRLAKAAAQARADVLDELAQMYANVPEQFLEGTYRLHSEWKEKIESLRHEQEREPE